jgi:hypothetical protein
MQFGTHPAISTPHTAPFYGYPESPYKTPSRVSLPVYDQWPSYALPEQTYPVPLPQPSVILPPSVIQPPQDVRDLSLRQSPERSNYILQTDNVVLGDTVATKVTLVNSRKRPREIASPASSTGGSSVALLPLLLLSPSNLQYLIDNPDYVSPMNDDSLTAQFSNPRKIRETELTPIHQTILILGKDTPNHLVTRFQRTPPPPIPGGGRIPPSVYPATDLFDPIPIKYATKHRFWCTYDAINPAMLSELNFGIALAHEMQVTYLMAGTVLNPVNASRKPSNHADDILGRMNAYKDMGIAGVFITTTPSSSPNDAKPLSKAIRPGALPKAMVTAVEEMHRHYRAVCHVLNFAFPMTGLPLLRDMWTNMTIDAANDIKTLFWLYASTRSYEIHIRTNGDQSMKEVSTDYPDVSSLFSSLAASLIADDDEDDKGIPRPRLRTPAVKDALKENPGEGLVSVMKNMGAYALSITPTLETLQNVIQGIRHDTSSTFVGRVGSIKDILSLVRTSVSEHLRVFKYGMIGVSSEHAAMSALVNRICTMNGEINTICKNYQRHAVHEYGQTSDPFTQVEYSTEEDVLLKEAFDAFVELFSSYGSDATPNERTPTTTQPFDNWSPQAQKSTLVPPGDSVPTVVPATGGNASGLLRSPASSPEAMVDMARAINTMDVIEMLTTVVPASPQGAFLPVFPAGTPPPSPINPVSTLSLSTAYSPLSPLFNASTKDTSIPSPLSYLPRDKDQFVQYMRAGIDFEPKVLFAALCSLGATDSSMALACLELACLALANQWMVNFLLNSLKISVHSKSKSGTATTLNPLEMSAT